ncbi:MAG: glycogen synthase GlgA [Deltaproteobacteria bacterium]|nr:glycogen synthase GlgA [Deltaproteobacteria bacterium]
MKVLVVSSEIVPFAKTGGLADVTGTLPKVLRRKGVEVDCILPKYKTVTEGNHRLEPVGSRIKVPIGNREEEGNILVTRLNDDVNFYLVQNERYFNRDFLYGTNEGDYVDNAERFIFFSRAVLEFLVHNQMRYDIIHANDWQTGLIPVYLKTIYSGHDVFSKIASVLTIHNLGYQGLFWSHDMPLTGLGWEMYTPQALEFYGKINFLKGGLVFSDVLNTVSETYAKEIQTEEFGFGLEGVLYGERDNLFGILNGVDYEIWSPETDPHIKANYRPDDLSGKLVCKKDLLDEYGFSSETETPVVGIISRLVAQKGFDILYEIGSKLAGLDVRFVVLGTGERKYEEFFREMASRYPSKFGVKIAYDDVIAHKIEAGADMLLMPSRYEPCGLNQIYSLKYGTVPIVRNTGGLADTVVDIDEQPGRGTGFKFYQYDSALLFETVARALSWYHKKEDWKKMMIRGMGQDFSWDVSASQYLDLYKTALGKRGVDVYG